VGALNSEIVNKAFSPDIIPGIVDEDAIGIPYEKLDLILLALEKGWDNDTIAAALTVGTEKVEYVPTSFIRDREACAKFVVWVNTRRYPTIRYLVG
jgi:NH3-dependent NAD+ synthetase